MLRAEDQQLSLEDQIIVDRVQPYGPCRRLLLWYASAAPRGGPISQDLEGTGIGGIMTPFFSRSGGWTRFVFGSGTMVLALALSAFPRILV